MNNINKLFLVLLVVFAFTKIQAQVDISGNVKDVNNEPLPFANILIKGDARGANTDIDGNFSLKNVSPKDVLEFSLIGYKTYSVSVGKKTFFEIQLQEDLQVLDEVVVTGVAVGTSVKKLGFALSKVKNEQLEEVPATDLGNALRGKMSGVKILQGNGDPNTPAAIRLRGSNSILGSQTPLIIIDGIITASDASLRDINMEDVASIEVIKGAAASSLYGSLSGNGVIQIITKRGKAGNGPKVVVRGEYGFSKIAKKYPLATTHRWKLRDGEWNLNDLDEQGRWELSSGGNRVRDEDGLLDNPFPRVLDNQDKVNTSRPNFILYASLSDGDEKFSYHLSGQRTSLGGAITGVNPSVRNNGRVNFDYMPNNKLSIKNSISYTQYKGYSAPYSARANTLYLEPWVDISERDPNGNYAVSPKGYKYLDSFYDNPLYEVGILENYFDRERLLFSPQFTYQFNNNWTVGAIFSHDGSRSESYEYTPKEYEEPDPSSDDNGYYSIKNSISNTDILQAFITYNKTFGNFNTRFTGKFLSENRERKKSSASGSDLLVGGVRTLDITSQDTRKTSSSQKEEKVNNFFVESNIDYKDKIIFNGLIRRDGSSLFGANNRWQTFGRVSLAYIVTEDFKIPNVDNLKTRFSWGVSGQRPRFETQYETYEVDRSGRLVPGILGNKDLLPSKVSEWEAGINASLFNNIISLEVNYAKTSVKNDFIKAPLPITSGFPYQWKNIGEIESDALELEIGANIINTKDFKWNVNLSWDKVNQKITDLGGIPPFSRNSSLFRVEEGRPYGRMFGYQIATDPSQLTLNDAGLVVNSLGSPNADVKGTLRPSDFELNEQGYLIIKGTKGTEKEQVIFISDANGDDKKVEIGNTNPDWNLGLSSVFSYKNFSLYFLLDHQHGGNIYNSTKQAMYRAERHREQQVFAAQKKHIVYSNSASNMDRGYSYTSHFIENATYTKIREISLGYTFRTDKSKRFNKLFKEIKLSLIGRNLFTFTDYTGYDPEVASISTRRGNIANPTNDRIDSRSYPQFRTFTGMIQIIF